MRKGRKGRKGKEDSFPADNADPKNLPLITQTRASPLIPQM